MKTIELFVCEICGTQYNDKAKCKECEKAHKYPTEVVSCKHLPYTSDRSGYPIRVVLKMNDGKEVEYHR